MVFLILIVSYKYKCKYNTLIKYLWKLIHRIPVSKTTLLNRILTEQHGQLLLMNLVSKE